MYQVLCHCLDCHKISGSTFSTNILVPSDGFSVTKGTPKPFARTGESGKTITSFFCGDCGSTLWRQGELFGENRIIKAGTLDMGITLEDARPVAEIYVRNRPSWVAPIPGATQTEGV